MTYTSNKPVPDVLNMGIWEDGAGARVWLPKHFYPERNDAKKFAVEELRHHWIETRVRTAWMCRRATIDELWRECDRDEPGAFECWEIR